MADLESIERDLDHNDGKKMLLYSYYVQDCGKGEGRGRWEGI